MLLLTRSTHNLRIPFDRPPVGPAVGPAVGPGQASDRPVPAIQKPSDEPSGATAAEGTLPAAAGQAGVRAAVLRLLLGGTPRLRRLVMYWATTCCVYVLAFFLIWLLVKTGDMPAAFAKRFCMVMALTVGSFYVLVRMSNRIGLAPSSLTLIQGGFAALAVVVAYAQGGTFRGAALSVLVVLTSFCGFALSLRQSVYLFGFALAALGSTMLWLTRTDPVGHPPLMELAHFALGAGMMLAIVFLTAQWNELRHRLKRQKLELSKALERINLLATHDELTRLPNRRHMNNLLRLEEARSDRASRALCIALLDIDNFKRINDGYGHAAGDNVLQVFSDELKNALGPTDALARWGGEEFLLLLPERNEDSGLVLLRGLQDRLKSIELGAALADVRISFSGGLTTLHPEETMADAIKRADEAMFRAKSEGRNKIRCYRPADAGGPNGIVLERDLPGAIRDGQLLLHYQAQIDSAGSIVGCEALVRWNHPTFGLLTPERFIPLAEHSGLIVPLGAWVINEACEQLGRWAQDEHLAHLTISVNVSPREFRHPAFVDRVLATLSRSAIAPQRLILELTETMLIEDHEETIGKMQALQAHGLRFSLDDFGTGYSSLSYLRRLPLSQIKIDKAFVRDVLTEGHGAVIAATIIALAHNLGLSAIAEGVETEVQRTFLNDHGCDFCQGYLVSKPIALSDFETLMHRTCRLAA